MADNNYLITERGYVEVFKAEFDMQVKSESFGFYRNLSIEGNTCEYHNKYHNDVNNQGKVLINFHSHFFVGISL